MLPIACVIDSKLFCLHGGIPPPFLLPDGIESINSIKRPLRQVDKESALAWELLWNDPQQGESQSLASTEMGDKRGAGIDGFVPNSRRGTGHCFSSAALERFLADNKLSHVVRAHEMKPTGFQVQQDGRLITVFSSSRYCNGTNLASCVLVDSGKLRMITLESS